MSAFLFILTSLYARRVRCSFMVMACLKKSMRWKRKDLLNALVEFQGRLPNRGSAFILIIIVSLSALWMVMAVGTRPL